MSARDDYPYWPAPDDRRFSAEGSWHWSIAMEEIDRLRGMVAVLTNVDDKAAEIQQAADSVSQGVPTCGAVWHDDQPRGWLWYCSLPVGHAGHHRCIGASW